MVVQIFFILGEAMIQPTVSDSLYVILLSGLRLARMLKLSEYRLSRYRYLIMGMLKFI